MILMLRIAYLLVFAPFTALPAAPLALTNEFKTAHEVLNHYLARDAEGFYYTGMLDRERTEFTAWKEPPSQDTFYVATSYSVKPLGTAEERSARFEVEYTLVSIADAHGTRVPVKGVASRKKVVYELQRETDGKWRIHRPEARSVVPVLSLKRVQGWIPELAPARPVSTPTR